MSAVKVEINGKESILSWPEFYSALSDASLHKPITVLDIVMEGGECHDNA